jgi:hypothetical protein
MDTEARAAVVATETVTVTELLPAAIDVGEMLQVVSAGAPLHTKLTWFAKGPPDEMNVIG